jgi:hypothetical protein
METRLMRSTLAVLLASLSFSAQAAEPTAVEATGEAAVEKNRPLARDRAIEDALRRAVEQVCGTLVMSSSEVKNSQLVHDKILTQAKGYVAGYDVLSEKEEKGVLRITVRAKVGTDKLSNDLATIGLTLVRKGMPRLAVLIAEQRIDEVKPAAWWGQGGDNKAASAMKLDQRLVENALIDAWNKVGFSFVDMEALSGKVKAAGVVSTTLTADQVREIGNLTDADVIIVGTAVATKQRDVAELVGDKQGDTKQVTCAATISARALNADSGEILATADASKNTFHLDALTCGREALLAASKDFAASLQAKIMEKWGKELGGTGRVRLRVKGLDSLGTLNELKALMLSKVRGVKGIDQKRFDKGSADLDVRLEGPADALASALEAKPVRKLIINVVSVTANTIDIELAAKKGTK